MLKVDQKFIEQKWHEMHLWLYLRNNKFPNGKKKKIDKRIKFCSTDGKVFDDLDILEMATNNSNNNKQIKKSPTIKISKFCDWFKEYWNWHKLC